MRPVPLHLGGNNSTWHVLHEGSQESSTCYYSTMAGPIRLNLGMQAGTHKIIRVRVSGVGCYSTCARAGGASTDLENGWAHCAQIWYAVRHRLVGCRAKVTLDPVCTCTRAGCRFQISGTAGSIASKFGRVFRVFTYWGMLKLLILQEYSIKVLN